MRIIRQIFVNLKAGGFRSTVEKSISRIINKINGWREPYEYVQMDVQNHLHKYLRVDKNAVQFIVIIGAHLGYEVSELRKNFKNAEFYLFEASPRYIKLLKSKFNNSKFVTVFDCAVSDSNHILKFFETNRDGSGSLQQIGQLAKDSYGMKQEESYEVNSIKLDDHAINLRYDNRTIDCIWIDVQGAEMKVLQGASQTIQRARSVFIEVSILEPLYDGGASHEQLHNYLGQNGFLLVSLGVDAANGTGNAFYINRKLIKFDVSHL